MPMTLALGKKLRAMKLTITLMTCVITMDKEEITKLPQPIQDFISSNKLEDESYDTIQWILKNYDYAVYKGWL